jgi:hypothetical protein
MNKTEIPLRGATTAGITALLVVLLLTTLPGTVRATTMSGLKPFRAEYSVENDYITGGVATLSLTPVADGGFDFILQTKPTGIFKWTGNGNIREHAVLPSLKPPFESVQYSYKDKGKPERNYQVDFDREGGQFRINKGSETTSHKLPTGVVDRLSVTLELLNKLSEDANFDTLQVQVLDGQKAETVTYKNHGQEVLNTRLGDLQASRISKVRINSSRETLIWLAELGTTTSTVLPLKIEQYKRGKLSLRLIISKFALVD